MRNLILFLAFSAIAFGQCGSSGALILNVLNNPPTWDCTAVSGAGLGSVTSVGLAGTANQITVTGSSPITSSGSWTLSIPTNPTLPGNTTGTFICNLTGSASKLGSGSYIPILASGTPSAAVAADIVGLFSTCSGTQYLGADGSCHTGSGTGTVTVVGAGSLTSTALVTGGGTTTIQTPSATATMDSSGNISTPGTISSGVGSGVAGALDLVQGTLPALGTTAITLMAPTSVTSYGLLYPGAAPAANQVLLWGAPSAGVSTGVFTNLPSGGTPASPVNSVQFNNAGSFGGSSHVTWDSSTQVFAVQPNNVEYGALFVEQDATAASGQPVPLVVALTDTSGTSRGESDSIVIYTTIDSPGATLDAYKGFFNGVDIGGSGAAQTISSLYFYDIEIVALNTNTSVGTIRGYNCGQIANLSGSGVTEASCFFAGDQTNTGVGGPMYGFNSTLDSGTGKWAFYGGGTAASHFGGAVDITGAIVATSLATATDKLPVCRHADGTLYNGTNTAGVLACP